MTCWMFTHMYKTRSSHNGHHSVSNHQPYECLLKRLFRCRSKKTPKLRITGLCAGNSPGTGEFPAQIASNTEMFPSDDVIMWCQMMWHVGIYTFVTSETLDGLFSSSCVVMWNFRFHFLKQLCWYAEHAYFATIINTEYRFYIKDVVLQRGSCRCLKLLDQVIKVLEKVAEYILRKHVLQNVLSSIFPIIFCKGI